MKKSKETVRIIVSTVAIIVGILIIMPAVYAEELIVLPKPDVVWVPADPSNFQVSDRPVTYGIDYIVIHDIEGSYQVAIDMFKVPNPSHASTQYVISKTGEITQMVEDKDIAWHAGNNEYSKHTIGIEHEGFADKCQFTEKEYMASARLVKWLAKEYDIPLDKLDGIAPADPADSKGIIGHYQVPNPLDPKKGGGLKGHYDPGKCWDWNHYMNLLTEGLYGSYYNEPIYRSNINAIATPDAVKMDFGIDFNWHPGNLILPPEIADDGSWSADWTGYLYAPWDGNYWFKLVSDDGSWLFIDGKKAVDNGGDHPPQEALGVITLKKGYHSLLVKYFESYGGDALISLYWMPPGETTYKIIPKDVLSVASLEEMLPNIEIYKKAPANMDPGNVIVYTLYYQNYGGPSVDAVLEDILPKEVDFISASDAGVYDSNTGNVKWIINSIDEFPNGVGSRTITVRIKSDVALGSVIKNKATITYGDKSSTTTVETTVTKSNLPKDASVGPIVGNTGGTPSVFWKDPITFSYYSECAAGIGIDILYSDGTHLTEMMTKSPDNMWSYIVPSFYPEHGEAKVTYTIAGCDKTTTVSFNIYIDPAGFIYDAATGARISGATVWLQQPDGAGGWENVDIGQTPPIMQPDTNPLITNTYGQYQWDVLNGTYRIHVEAQGYYPADSIAVNIPPPVTDLDVGLTHLPDDTPPTTIATITGTLGNNDWYTTDVEVNLAAVDNEGGTGVNITEYSFDNETWNIYTKPFNVTTEGITTIYYRSTDYADNTESTKNQTIKIDKTSPEITSTLPTNGSYILNQPLIAIWQVNDKVSGLAKVNATIANGSTIDTSKAGPQILNILAIDNAGNTANITVNFSISYIFNGFFSPLAKKKTYNAGSAISIKFNLTDYNGKNIDTAIPRVYIVSGGVETNATSKGKANTGNIANFDIKDKQYFYILDTTPIPIGPITIRVRLDDGTMHETEIIPK